MSSAAIVGFATGGWALRAPERAAGSALLALTLAAARSGAAGPAALAARAAFGTSAPRLRAGIWWTGTSSGVVDAALRNGIAAGGQAGLAVPVVAAALAAGDAAAAPGAVVVDAIVAGCEIALRVAAALGAGHAARGWDADATCGRLGAAIAATRIFGLNAERTRNALGIAATESSGLLLATGTMTGPYQRGLAAADGVEAALLARYGFTGAPAAIEGRRGLAALMAPAYAPEQISDGLGERYRAGELVEPTVLAAARATLPAALLDALDHIAELPLLDLSPLLR